MRWHFAADGQLQQIDLADGAHRIRTNWDTIKSFTRDNEAEEPELPAAD
jgi:hypothetical protein